MPLLYDFLSCKNCPTGEVINLNVAFSAPIANLTYSPIISASFDFMKLISIITVNYNQPIVTEALLHSIFTVNRYANVELIVVDNASKINPIALWKDKFPSVIFVRSEINLGFAGGNNLGIKYAKGEYLFLVNNDTEFSPCLVNQLVSVLDNNKKVGIVSPKIHYFDRPETLQYVGYTEMNFYTSRNKCIGQFEKDRGQYNNLTGKTGYAHGAAMMVKRETISKVGLMAENFFLYYEELDWAERIKKEGYEVWVDAEALIFHKESVSVGKQSALKEYYMNRNRILFERKHAPFLPYAFFIGYFLLIVTPRNILNYLKNKQKPYILVLLKAIWWNFTNSVNSNNLYFPKNT